MDLYVGKNGYVHFLLVKRTKKIGPFGCTRFEAFLMTCSNFNVGVRIYIF